MKSPPTREPVVYNEKDQQKWDNERKIPVDMKESYCILAASAVCNNQQEIHPLLETTFTGMMKYLTATFQTRT